MKNKKPLSTYDEHLQNLSPEAVKAYKKGYQEFLLSELVIAAMHEDDVSVRALAKAAGISPTIVQEIRIGKRKNLSLQSFLKIVDALGYSFVLEKPGKNKKKAERIPLHAPASQLM
ncbi:MAG: helix-turn-helix transcriptional regulator [Candidatus Babeliales bacterium]|jgi:transcriptional regulator with XRE-family HTH domain